MTAKQTWNLGDFVGRTLPTPSIGPELHRDQTKVALIANGRYGYQLAHLECAQLLDDKNMENPDEPGDASYWGDVKLFDNNDEECDICREPLIQYDEHQLANDLTR